MRSEILEALLADRAARRPAVLLTWLEENRETLVHAPDEIGEDAALAQAVGEALRRDRAARVDTDSGPVFVHPYNPALRLAIVGAVHIAQHLAEIATRMGFAVTVVDPRTAFASPERFPRIELSHEWPDLALERLGLDVRSAVVTLSHDPKLDDPALDAALRSEAFYIGALGSRRTQARRADRLESLGFDEAARSRVHGPIGLDIGALGPAEIAVSIAGEIVTALRGSST